MTLHQDPVAFREAVLGTAATLGLRQDLIEKDYWPWLKVWYKG